MTNEIKSGKLLIKQVFDNENWYRIPEYQRPYVWEKEQVTELLEDISNFAKNNKDAEYFLGSIVYKITKKQQGDVAYEEKDLLDGQQRLTTLFLIMAVIRDLEKDKNKERAKTCQESIYQKENSDDSIPERLRIVFDIRDDVKQFIDTYVKEEGQTLSNELQGIANNEEKDISIRNISTAILTIRDYFRNNSIDDFFPYLRTKVLMIYVASENLDDAFRLFTIINNRGMKLRSSDILKAENLRVVSDAEKRKEYAKLWEDIENDFGDDFDEFLSHMRTILAKDKALTNLLDEFEEKIYKNGSLTKGKATFEFMKKYYQYYAELFEESNYELNNTFEFDNLISTMRAVLPSNIWIPVLLAYYDKFKKVNLIKFLKKLDNKISYDWISQETPTKRIENMNAIIKKIEKVSTSEELFKSEIFEVDVNLLIKLVSGQIYGKAYSKYLLYKLDYIFGSKSQNLKAPKEISIEHILPRHPKKGSIWLKNFNPTVRETWGDKIGNLVLISRRKNTSQGNLDYSEKKKKYFENNIETFPNVLRVLKNDNWLLTDLKNNQELTLNKLKVYYAE